MYCMAKFAKHTVYCIVYSFNLHFLYLYTAGVGPGATAWWTVRVICILVKPAFSSLAINPRLFAFLNVREYTVSRARPFLTKNGFRHFKTFHRNSRKVINFSPLWKRKLILECTLLKPYCLTLGNEMCSVQRVQLEWLYFTD